MTKAIVEEGRYKCYKPRCGVPKTKQALVSYPLSTGNIILTPS